MYSECSKEICLCRTCILNYRNSTESMGCCMDCIDCDAETDSLLCEQCSSYEREDSND